ncbi:hypothetical protein SH528x_007315 [Novipirellula sp. SH528]|uniref:hypothetical protein n=1 Tax=Novipirellula sp. SH528 TaxID=3454466 RepID=UPI003FA0D689
MGWLFIPGCDRRSMIQDRTSAWERSNEDGGSGTEYWDMLAASSPERSEHVLRSLRVALPSLSRANFSPAYPFIQFAQMVSVDMAKRRKTITDMKTAVDNSSLGAGAALAT